MNVLLFDWILFSNQRRFSIRPCLFILVFLCAFDKYRGTNITDLEICSKFCSDGSPSELTVQTTISDGDEEKYESSKTTKVTIYPKCSTFSDLQCPGKKVEYEFLKLCSNSLEECSFPCSKQTKLERNDYPGYNNQKYKGKDSCTFRRRKQIISALTENHLWIAPGTANYTDALIQCQSQNMSLIRIENNVTNQLLYKYTLKHNVSRYWIDGTDEKSENKWLHSDGTVLNYTNFGLGEPNGGRKENCIEGNRYENSDIWNDIRCNELKFVICYTKFVLNVSLPVSSNTEKVEIFFQKCRKSKINYEFIAKGSRISFINNTDYESRSTHEYEKFSIKDFSQMPWKLNINTMWRSVVVMFEKNDTPPTDLDKTPTKPCLEDCINDILIRFNNTGEDQFKDFVSEVKKVQQDQDNNKRLSTTRMSLAKLLFSQTKKHADNLAAKMIQEKGKKKHDMVGFIETYVKVLDATDTELDLLDFPMANSSKGTERNFVRLSMAPIEGNNLLISSLTYFHNTDIVDESNRLHNYLNSYQLLKPMDIQDSSLGSNGVILFKNSDIFSLHVNSSNISFVEFKLKTFEKNIRTSWLVSVEEECGYLESEENWKWSTAGCWKVIKSNNEIYCKCNHLTNFAMLFSLREVNREHIFVFNILSVMAGIITCLSLALLLIFVIFINTPDKRRLDQLNIALFIFSATLMFMFGAVMVTYKTLCVFVAIFNQFLFMAAFVWKLILGINVIKMMKRRDDLLVKYRTAVMIIGYAVPVVLVSLSGYFFWDDYGEVSSNVCWMKSGSKAHMSFIIPVAMAVITNLVLIIIIGEFLIENYLRVRKTKVSRSNELLVFIQLSATMGMTWIPSFFSTHYLVAMYLMILIYPLQGMLMFVFIVVVHKENRDKFLTYISRSHSTETSKTSNSSKGNQMIYVKDSSQKSKEFNLHEESDQYQKEICT